MPELEKLYRQKLSEMHGITFTNLFTINNLPIGRFRKKLSEDELDKYLQILEDSFNPASVENMMCRSSISFGFDGRTYDCDLSRVIDLPMKTENSSIDDFDYEVLSKREIVTNPICFVCSAGAGVGCSELF